MRKSFFIGERNKKGNTCFNLCFGKIITIDLRSALRETICLLNIENVLRFDRIIYVLMPDGAMHTVYSYLWIVLCNVCKTIRWKASSFHNLLKRLFTLLSRAMCPLIRIVVYLYMHTENNRIWIFIKVNRTEMQ